MVDHAVQSGQAAQNRQQSSAVASLLRQLQASQAGEGQQHLRIRRQRSAATCGEGSLLSSGPRFMSTKKSGTNTTVFIEYIFLQSKASRKPTHSSRGSVPCTGFGNLRMASELLGKGRGLRCSTPAMRCCFMKLQHLQMYRQVRPLHLAATAPLMEEPNKLL